MCLERMPRVSGHVAYALGHCKNWEHERERRSISELEGIKQADLVVRVCKQLQHSEELLGHVRASHPGDSQSSDLTVSLASHFLSPSGVRQL